MQVMEFIQHPKIFEILEMNEQVKREKQFAGYNLFTISSYTFYLENFHSDIICSLLDPSGLHNEGYIFLNIFIEYINKSYDRKIDLGKYKNVTVLRERGRLDVWIKDESSKHSIILENKINDAPDRDDQLLDYYDYAIRKDYKVDAVIYLSKNGNKIAPAQNRIIEAPIINVGAFTNTKNDMMSGWLKPCLSAAKNEDSRSFLHQYCKLISHLSNTKMENEIREAFYQFVDQNNAIQTIEDLKNLITALPEYRAEKFGELVTEISPFKKRFRWQRNYWIFERFKNRDDNYKLDVFFENTGGAKVVMWNTEKNEKVGYETVKAILQEIGLLERFNGTSLYNGLTAEFDISDKYPSISSVDNAVLQFVLLVFKNLKNSFHE